MSNTSARRDRHDIVAEILETARDGAAKTHIMHEAKLSYCQVSEYIPILVEKGFLKNITVRVNKQVKHLFKTTELGGKYLKNLRAVDRIWSS